MTIIESTSQTDKPLDGKETIYPFTLIQEIEPRKDQLLLCVYNVNVEIYKWKVFDGKGCGIDQSVNKTC